MKLELEGISSRRDIINDSRGTGFWILWKWPIVINLVRIVSESKVPGVDHRLSLFSFFLLPLLFVLSRLVFPFFPPSLLFFLYSFLL